ncbi:MAG: 30S ribosomal protein S17 [Planctomycetota bacterium]|jgi:small subunit ribosomal protein S17
MADNSEQVQQRKGRRTAVGAVVSAHKTPKTIRVKVQYKVRHRIYGKYVRKQTVLNAHDEKEEANHGDVVQLMECRPISKSKTWRLVKVLERSPEAVGG